MKKYIPIIFIFVFLSFNKKGNSQALPIYSQYMFNEYLINSAYAGTYHFTPIIINNRNQWIGFGDSAPKTSSISAHTGFGEKSAIGASLISDKTSPISRTQIEATYGYHTILGESRSLILSMALSRTFNTLQFTHQEGMTYSEIMDGMIDYVSQANENSSTGDINFGMVLFNDYFDFGLSVRNLLSSGPSNNSTDVERVRYLVFHGSYLGRNNPTNPIGIIPSFVVRKMGIISYNSLFQLDLNIKLIYRNKIWAGVAYRTHEKAICTLLGINHERGFFGWSYDVGTSELGSYHNGSHNIAIGLNIAAKKKRKVRNQNPFYLNIDSQWRKINFSSKRNKSGI